jgi:hypothetical protein
MRTSTQKPIARLLGLLVLSLLVVALSVAAAQARPTPAQVQRAYDGPDAVNPAAGSGTVSAATMKDGWLGMPAASAGSGTVGAATVTDGWLGMPAASAGSGTVGAATPAPSGTSSTTVWIAIGSAVAVLIIAILAWVLIRRRRQPSVPGSSAYCARHPEDALCAAG